MRLFRKGFRSALSSAVLLAILLAALLTSCSSGTGEASRFEAAFAVHEPDETVVTVNGRSVPWKEFFCYIVYYITYVEEDVGAVGNWNAPYYGDISLQQFVLDGAVEWLTFDAALERDASADGCFLQAEDEKILDAEWEELIAKYGSEDALKKELASYCCTEELYRKILRNLLLSEKYLDALYGENGARLTDGEAEEFTACDGYLMAKQIFISTVETDGEGNTVPVAEEAYRERLSLAQKLAQELKNAPEEERETRFEELKSAYGADARVSFYEASLFTASDVGAEIYDGTLATALHSVSGILETEGGFHVMLRLPVDYDAVPMAYSGKTGREEKQYSLRSLTANAMYEKRMAAASETIPVTLTALYDSLDFNGMFAAG